MNPHRNLLLWWAAVLLLPTLAAAQQPMGSAVAATRSALEEWTETARLISREKQDWQLGEATLRDRIDLLRREIAAMQQRIAEAEASMAATEEQHETLAAEDTERRATEKLLRERVVQLEASLCDLLPLLPEPLCEIVRPVSQLISLEPEAAEQRLDERYRNVLFVAKQIHKWNREMTQRSEIRTLSDGSNVEVAVMYVGLGQAYYTDRNGKVAGIGRATPTGWVWMPADDLAEAIAEAIAILRNEKVAAFVRLPVQIL